MERGPLLGLLHSMKGTNRKLNVYVQAQESPVAIENVEDVEELHSAHGIKITTKQNHIWLDSSHVSLAFQARDDAEPRS
jgi:hypothetical protein